MVEETLDQASRMGAPRAVALCRNFDGFLKFQSGRWDDAEKSLRSAVETYRAHGAASGESLSLQRLGVLLTARGRIGEGREALEAGVAVAQRATMRSHCLTRLYASIVRNRLAARDLESADRHLELGQDEAARHGNCVTCNGLLLPESVRVHLARNRMAAALTDVDRLEAIAATFGSRVWTAMARQARGRYLAAKGETEQAAAALSEAEQTYAVHGDVYEAARCRVARAHACSGPAERDALIASAHDMLEGLGATRASGDLACGL